MTVHGMHRKASIDINASQEAVYALVSDLPRMEEWSPENIVCDTPRYRLPRHHPYTPWKPEENASMPWRPRPETEEEPQRCGTAQRLRTIERWLQHADEELLYAPDAQGEDAATPLDARYYLRWGGGGMGVLAILRFLTDARHPVAQKPYGAYGESL